MLGTRNPTGRLHENVGFRAGIRRRHGSLSSLPSSSVSGRPLRDRKRTDDRRKVRDMKVNIIKSSILEQINPSHHHQIILFFPI